MEVRKDLEPIHDNFGDLSGYRMPDGTELHLVVGLMVDSPTNNEVKYVATEEEMAQYGMELGEYHRADFDKEPVEQ